LIGFHHVSSITWFKSEEKQSLMAILGKYAELHAGSLDKIVSSEMDNSSGVKMMTKKMCMRDRMLAVIQGKEHDQIPFAMYEIMFPPQEAFDLLGRGNIGIIRFSPIVRFEHPNCRFVSDLYYEGGHKMQKTILATPKGNLEEIRIFEPMYDSSTAVKHFISQPSDYEIFWSYLQDCTAFENYDHYLQDCADLGEDGLAKAELERSPWQQLWIEWVGLEGLSIHQCDCPDLVEETLIRLTERARKTFDIAFHSPAPFIDIPDNITAPAIGIKRFQKYIRPFYDELGNLLAERGAPLFSHMDGFLRPLRFEIAETNVRGMDSFTPTPDCDMSIAEAVTLWPEKILWVNFPSSVFMQAEDKIREKMNEILTCAGHTGKLQIQISENIPLDRWQGSFPIIVEEIERFGTP